MCLDITQVDCHHSLNQNSNKRHKDKSENINASILDISIPGKKICDFYFIFVIFFKIRTKASILSDYYYSFTSLYTFTKYVLLAHIVIANATSTNCCAKFVRNT